MGVKVKLRWAAALLTFALSQSQAQNGPSVTASNVTYLGIQTAGGAQEAFLGIPFAQPPTGERRFKAPEPLQSTGEATTVEATAYGKGCPQVASVFGVIVNQSTVDEDCLTLNIYRPANLTTESKLPVYFWIYGGGFFSGVSEGYDPTQIISQSLEGEPVIYVSTNYRTGLWGFLPGQESVDNGAANAGLKDQRMALKWVQDNIGRFGGDATKVTILGESAGSISVGWQLLRPSEGLFRGGIMESGSPGSYPTVKAAQRQLTYDAIANLTGCADATNTFSCLQSASPESLTQTMGMIQSESTTRIGGGGFAFGPVSDGWISDSPEATIKAGKWAKVPFIDGNNLDEGTIFTIFSKQHYNSTEQIVNYLSTVYPANKQEVVNDMVNLYATDAASGSPFGTGDNVFGRNAGFKRLAAIYGDVVFGGPRRSFLRSATKQKIPAYGYLFTEHIIPESATDSLWLGVYHSAELGFVYNDGDYALANPTEGQQKLSRQMTEYWLEFVRKLDPNPTNGTARMDLPVWPTYTSDGTILNLTSAGPHQITDNYRYQQIEYIIEHPGLN